ncbi:MAG: 2-amino-4-hydroxy-6-hydroxymethyldihydropteridine diphosphokinase [Desulfovibrionales bacterium]
MGVHKAYVGLGSNMGDREGSLAQARGKLQKVPGLEVARLSRIYETEPQDHREQPWFANQVVEVQCTDMNPFDLLKNLQHIEVTLGRVRKTPKGPRTVDLDLLLFGTQTIHTAELTLPHPRMRERAFVLVPLHEICPTLVFPDGDTLTQALSRVMFRLEDTRIWQS